MCLALLPISVFVQTSSARTFINPGCSAISVSRVSLYDGEYDGFPLTVEIGRLLSISEEDPEFHYRVSFQKATDVNGVDKASKDLRVLMKEWCERSRGVTS